MTATITKQINAALAGTPHKAVYVPADEGEPVDDMIEVTPRLGLQIGYNYIALNEYELDADGEFESMLTLAFVERDEVAKIIPTLLERLS